jgi:hypothetical protein
VIYVISHASLNSFRRKQPTKQTTVTPAIDIMIRCITGLREKTVHSERTETSDMDVPATTAVVRIDIGTIRDLAT